MYADPNRRSRCLAQTHIISTPPDPAPPLQLHHQIHRPFAVPLHLLKSHSKPRSHHHDRQSVYGLPRRIGVNRRERSPMPGIDRLQKRPALLTTQFAQDDPIRPHPKRCFQKPRRCSLPLAVPVSLQRHNIRLCREEFVRILNGHQSVLQKGFTGRSERDSSWYLRWSPAWHET